MGDGNRTDELRRTVRLRRQRRDRSLREGERSLAQNLVWAGTLGWLIVGPTLAGLFLGRWIDRRFGSGIMFSALLCLLGVLGGSVLAWAKGPAAMIWRIAVHFAGGIALGLLHFAALHRNVRAYLAGRLSVLAVVLHVARLVVIGAALFWVARRSGALVLVVLAGFTAARLVILRRLRDGR